MKIKLVFLFLLFSVGCVGQSQTLTSKNSATNNNHLATTPANVSQVFSSVDYQSKLKAIAADRAKFADQYRQATSSAAKNEIIEKARETFVAAIDQSIFPFWYGTDWDFYGTTEKPGDGAIACGYFVTTVLRDSGVRVNRVSLAQQASENIIKSLTTEPHIKRFRHAAITDFVEAIAQTGVGLYVVGLDFHVGFILHDGSETYFIHSSYVAPSEVVREKAVESIVLANSKYRIVGKISADDKFIVKWLDQSAIPTFGR